MFNRYTKINRDKEFDNKIERDFVVSGYNDDKRVDNDKLAKAYLKRAENYLNNFKVHKPKMYNSGLNDSRTSILDRSLDHSRMNFTSNKFDRINESVKYNQIYDLEPFNLDKKFEFRSRSVTKEIQESMKYKTTNDFKGLVESLPVSERERKHITDQEIRKKMENQRLKDVNKFIKKDKGDDAEEVKLQIKFKDPITFNEKSNTSILTISPKVKREIINEILKDYKRNDHMKIMQEVANGIILNDHKNFNQDNKIKQLNSANKSGNSKDKLIDSSIFSKFIAIKINKNKGWAPINDKDGRKKAKEILLSTSYIKNKPQWMNKSFCN